VRGNRSRVFQGGVQEDYGEKRVSFDQKDPGRAYGFEKLPKTNSALGDDVKHRDGGGDGRRRWPQRRIVPLGSTPKARNCLVIS